MGFSTFLAPCLEAMGATGDVLARASGTAACVCFMPQLHNHSMGRADLATKKDFTLTGKNLGEEGVKSKFYSLRPQRLPTVPMTPSGHWVSAASPPPRRFSLLGKQTAINYANQTAKASAQSFGG
ncbi:hypothetical protein TREES_T100006505 [Tupaia chinensis]|uniref:Uncharacterized protein n=1 Tax=Tupaia chinensis TaxID=246437 RepID=L9KW54_TUPCH|nr:hypothetical protein TREES_T100006505 [Tupaia chinensis]